MNLVLWCATGAVIALLASFRDEMLCRQRLLVDIVFSGVGAMLGGMLAAPLAQWLSFDTHWPSSVA